MKKYQPQLIEVDPQRIKFNALNPRKHGGEEFERLKQSIAEIGIIQPPMVRVLPGGFYEVIDGEGRVSAAQDLRLAKIWVTSLGIVDDQESLTMLVTTNVIRNFNFIAECRGLANLHRQGFTCEALKKQFREDEATILRKVNIGYLPADLLARIQEEIARADEQTTIWGIRMLTAILTLRQLLPGKSLPNRYTKSFDDLYDYTEVRRAIEKVLNGEITSSSEMEMYVKDRRLELVQERFDQELQTKLQGEIETTKRMLQESAERQLQAAEEQTRRHYEEQTQTLKRQIDTLQNSLDEIVRESTRRPEKIAALEDNLRKRLEEIEQDRAILRTKQRQADEEARKAQERLQVEIRQTLQTELAKMRDEQERKREEVERDLKSLYAQKDQARQLKAENTVNSLLSHSIKVLAEAQMSVNHVASSGILPGVRQLGGSQIESLLWQIRSMRDALDQAEEKLTHDVVASTETTQVVESEIAHGRW